jgi:anti-sigma B factor antagonist
MTGNISMDIRERNVDGVTILELGGRFTASDQPGQLKDAVADAVRRGTRRLLLDLSGVQYIDSTRLGELIAAHVTLSRQGGRLTLAATPARIVELLDIAGLDGIFERHDTVDQAILAVRGSSPAH